MKFHNIEQISLYSPDGKDSLPYYQEPLMLKSDYSLMERFIKNVEKLVRKDPRYDRYLAKVHEAGILKCAILGNLKPDEVTVEMHHGPIFTLYTIVEIVTRYHIFNDHYFSTFSIAEEVLDLHERNMVQIVGLSKTPHKAWHMQKIFVHIKAAFGRVDKFIEEYRDGMGNYHINEALRFVDLCKQYETTIDNDLFETSKRISFKPKKVS